MADVDVVEDECCEKSAKFDELLSEAVRKYPSLYDKRSKDFKDKNIKSNAWKDVAREVGLKSAKKAFRNLRNRYGRDKKKIKKVKISGTGSESVSEVQKETSEMFPYLHWLDEYIQPRNTTTSLEAPPSVEDEDEDDSDKEATDVSTSSMSADCTEKSSTTGRQKFRKRQSKPVAVEEIDKLELKLLHTVSENLASKSAQINVRDEASLFGELIASQLRQLPFQDRTMAKMEVTNVLCQCLLKLNSEASHPEINPVTVSTSTASTHPDVYNMGLRSVVNPSPTPHSMNIQNTELQPSVNRPPTPSCNRVVPDVYGNQNPPYPPGYFFNMLKRN